MKRSVVSVVSVLSLFVFVSIASAFTPPDGKIVGAKSDGTVWIAKSIVDKKSGYLSAVMIGLDMWYSASKITLDGDYYVVKGKYPLPGQTIQLCFDAGNNQFLIDGLEGLVNWPYPVVDNGKGGSNIRVTIVR